MHDDGVEDGSGSGRSVDVIVNCIIAYYSIVNSTLFLFFPYKEALNFPRQSEGVVFQACGFTCLGTT